MNKFRIHRFLRNNKYKIITVSIVGAVVITSTAVIANMEKDISYDNKNVTRKQIVSVDLTNTNPVYETKVTERETETKETIEETEESTMQVETTEVESIFDSTIALTSPTVAPTTHKVEETKIEPTTKKSNDNNNNNNNVDGYYIDPDGNMWNSYEEYKQFNDIIEEGANTYTYTR